MWKLSKGCLFLKWFSPNFLYNIAFIHSRSIGCNFQSWPKHIQYLPFFLFHLHKICTRLLLQWFSGDHDDVKTRQIQTIFFQAYNKMKKLSKGCCFKSNSLPIFCITYPTSRILYLPFFLLDMHIICTRLMQFSGLNAISIVISHVFSCFN